jgi:4-carboxymuconolactone decarboxylase
MSQVSPRIPPVPRAEWTAAVRDVFAIIEGPAARENGSRFNVILTLANHPDLAIPFLTFSSYLLRSSSLPGRVRELAILRVTHLCRCEYEWSQHVGMAKLIGVTAQEIAAIEDGADSPGWSPVERQVLRAVDELRTNFNLKDETWNALAAHLDRHQLMDLVFTVGSYVLVSMAMNTMRVQPEPAKPAT